MFSCQTLCGEKPKTEQWNKNGMEKFHAPKQRRKKQICLYVIYPQNGFEFAEASCCSNFQSFIRFRFLPFFASSWTKRVHRPTNQPYGTCVCVSVLCMSVYALFAIVSRIIWKCRHVFISCSNCVPISCFFSFNLVPLVFIPRFQFRSRGRILAYRQVKIQFYINTHTVLSPKSHKPTKI